VPLTIADVYSALYDSPPDQKLAFVRWVATRFAVPARARDLDMGCGTARLIPGLARRVDRWPATSRTPCTRPRHATALPALRVP
jgi:hypothetical protein